MIPEKYLRADGRIKSSAPLEYRELFFLKKAKEKHGDLYDYSNTEYLSAKDKVVITCRIHGDFEQKPNAHLTGNGCPSCAGKRITTKDIVTRFKKAHGELYDYSRVTYHSAKDKVTIICKIHGEFQQSPNNHQAGDGCPSCANRDLDTYKVIDKFEAVHRGTYDYSKLNFSTTTTKLEIVCRKHGSFFQRYHDHLNGHGCAKCSSNVDTIYLWKLDTYVKVGVTSSRRKFARAMEVCREAGWDYDKVEYLRYDSAEDPLSVEKAIKDLLRPYRCSFNYTFDGYTEIYSDVPDTVLQEARYVM